LKYLIGKFHDQGDAKWIVIRRSLSGYNDTPCGRPAPGRPIGRPQGLIGVFSYYQLVIQKNLVHPTSVISNSLTIKTKICFTVVVYFLLLGVVRKDFLPYKTLNWMLKRWSDGPDSSVLIFNIVPLIMEFIYLTVLDQVGNLST
jgi:hypothetical protein